MEQSPNSANEAGSIDALLRDELSRSDQAADNNAVILRHLLRSDDQSVFSDEVVARVRAMLGDIDRQLVIALAEAAGHVDFRRWADSASGEISDTLAGNAMLLGHLHALALEFQLTERLQAQRSLDPVLSPLLQAQVASQVPEVATLAMQFLAAQSRFCQTQRRMEMPLSDLPGDMFHLVLLTMRAWAGEEGEADSFAAAAEAKLRSAFSEECNRAGLAASLLEQMGSEAAEALSIDHAGVALFLTAVAIGARQDRDAVMMSTTDGQLPRLVLELATCGLKAKGIAAQFLALHPDFELPPGIEALHADRAAAILSQSAGAAGH